MQEQADSGSTLRTRPRPGTPASPARPGSCSPRPPPRGAAASSRGFATMSLPRTYHARATMQQGWTRPGRGYEPLMPSSRADSPRESVPSSLNALCRASQSTHDAAAVAEPELQIRARSSVGPPADAGLLMRMHAGARPPRAPAQPPGPPRPRPARAPAGRRRRSLLLRPTPAGSRPRRCCRPGALRRRCRWCSPPRRDGPAA